MQFADGRTRAFVNDQPVSVQVMKQLGEALVEIHGQHDERALVDAATHRRLLDAFGGLEADAGRVEALWEARRAAAEAADAHRAEVERAKREADWLRHAVEELGTARAAGRRGDRARRAAHRHDAGGKGRGGFARRHEVIAGANSSVPALAGVIRRLERRQPQAPPLIEPAVKSLDAALNALEETRGHLEAALRAADYDPAELERIEERLFALRAAGRKYNVPVDDLAALARKYKGDIALIDAGEEKLKAPGGGRARAEADYRAAATALSKARVKAAAALDKAVNGELKPLKLERAKFSTEIDSDAASAGPNGIDRVEFWVQTNPGTKPGPLMKVASGGELARFLLALKVVLADRGSAPTLVFDEIDTGVGGAVADAIGVRLASSPRRAGAGGDACAAGRRARRPALPHQQGRAGEGQARRHPRRRSRGRAPTRRDRPHAGRRRDHQRGARRRRAADQGGELVVNHTGSSPRAPRLLTPTGGVGT